MPVREEQRESRTSLSLSARWGGEGGNTLAWRRKACRTERGFSCLGLLLKDESCTGV